MITIHLNNLRFFSFHGLHEEETLLGNEYEINADVRFHEEQERIDSLDKTVNYADIFELIKQRMQIATPLLETVVILFRACWTVISGPEMPRDTGL